MTASIPEETIRHVEARLGHRFQIDQTIAHSAERMLFRAWDSLLKRSVSLRVNIDPTGGLRPWFLREAEAMARLDHPAIRHVYEAGIVDELAYRVGNWIEGESLAEALERGPRPIPTALVLARDLLGALEHAHANGVIIRRVVPSGLLISMAGRSIVTDLRFCNLILSEIPTSERPSGRPFMAPEIRDGKAGDPAADIYTAGAILYLAVTGTTIPEDPAHIVPPRRMRAIIPAALERVILRALLPEPRARYLTASEMLEDFTSAAGTFEAATESLPTLSGDMAEGPQWEATASPSAG